MLLDLLFTPRCIGCQRLGNHLCNACRLALQPQRREFNSPKLEVLSAGFYQGWLRDSIVRFKSGVRSEVFGLAELAALTIPAQCRIVSVPTTVGKVRERGYDTIGLLARQIVRRRPDVEYLPVLRVSRSVNDQVGLSATERRANLSGAFGCIQPVTGDFVVLDDVVTTGSTAQECARALRSAGAKKVSAFSVCISANKR
jgi:ComF family protein